MPPANSPNRSATPSTFISALRGLESPVNEDVLNLAATLQVSDDDETMDEARASLRYLRATREQEQQARSDSPSDSPSDHGNRLQRSIDRLDRLHELSAASPSAFTTSTAPTPPPASTAQYGEGVPRQNRLHDWSPLPNAELDDDDLRSLRALQSRLSNPAAAAAESGSLRSTAILQSVRRHPRFSARTREYLQRYNHERDQETTRDAARQAARDTAALRRSTQDAWAGYRERHPQTLPPSLPLSQPPSQPQPQPEPPTVAPMLEHTVKYLSRIRHANTVDESLNCALEAGFLSKDYFCIQYADFLTDTLSIPPPQETSWLAPGAVLSGCQHATTSNPASTLAAAQLPPPSRPWLSTSYSTPRSLTSYLSPNAPARPEAAPQPPPHQDRWPVKVTIHAVDWTAMSLSATMEAYNVPSHPHQHSLTTPPPSQQQYTRTSSITTYLEGEILDFTTHTLLTESFKSSPANDALYWRKLPPFRDLDDGEVVRALTSRKWWGEMSGEWVLMRWKERCFVKSLRASKPSPTPNTVVTHAPSPAAAEPQQTEYYTYDSHTLARHDSSQPRPQLVDPEHAAFDDSGCGLTISGFYYVCLRRSDGRVEGLYYDPMSSPYQCLELRSESRGRFGSWSFS